MAPSFIVSPLPSLLPSKVPLVMSSRTTEASRRASAQKLRSTVVSLEPSVPYLTASEFASISSPLLVDVRTPEEIAVGTLSGSVTVPELSEILPSSPLSRPVIAFCTVGLRSAAYARQLRLGDRPVYNYSILEHVWDGGELVRPDGSPWEGTVHAYTDRYGDMFPAALKQETYHGWSVVKNVLPALPALLSLLGAWVWRKVLFRGNRKTNQNGEG